MKSLTAHETMSQLIQQLPFNRALERMAELSHALRDGAVKSDQPVVEVTFEVEKKDN